MIYIHRVNKNNATKKPTLLQPMALIFAQIESKGEMVNENYFSKVVASLLKRENKLVRLFFAVVVVISNGRILRIHSFFSTNNLLIYWKEQSCS